MEHRIAPSFHDYPELSLVCEGEGRFTVERRVYPVRARDLLLVGSREFHRMEAVGRSVVRVASIHFRPEFIHAPGDSPLGFEYVKPFCHRGPQFSHAIAGAHLPSDLIRDRIRRLHEEIEARRPDYPLAVRTYFTDILFEISRHFSRSADKLEPLDRRAREFDRLLGVFSYIRKHCHERLTLRDLARMAHLSPSYFDRVFKRLKGLTPLEYRRHLKL